MRRLFPLAIVLNLAACSSKEPAWYGVDVSIGTQTFSGTMEFPLEVDPAKPDILAQLKATGEKIVWFWADLTTVVAPDDSFAYSGNPAAPIDLSDVTQIKRRVGPYDGRRATHNVYAYDARTTRFLKKPALAQCNTKDIEGSDYWLSYDPKVGQKQLQPLCDYSASKGYRQAMLKKPLVIFLPSQNDD